MTERELERRAQRRLAVLRHVEEVSGNVAAPPEAHYPVANEQSYAVAQWVVSLGRHSRKPPPDGPGVAYMLLMPVREYWRPSRGPIGARSDVRITSRKQGVWTSSPRITRSPLSAMVGSVLAVGCQCGCPDRRTSVNGRPTTQLSSQRRVRSSWWAGLSLPHLPLGIDALVLNR